MILIDWQMRRPSHSELNGKILKVRAKISSADWHMANPVNQFPEFHALSLWMSGEMTSALESALNEIKPEHYAGARPPQRSYERACSEAELFAFAWNSQHFRRRIYLKFCFVRDTFFIVSFHPERRR